MFGSILPMKLRAVGAKKAAGAGAQAEFCSTILDVGSRNGFQMAAGWMWAGPLRPGRRLKALEERNRGKRP
jgi:hypothetical protein